MFDTVPRSGTGALGITWSRALLAALFCFGGVMHFVAPAPYIAIVPPALPSAPLLVAISGVFEILGGLGVLLPQTRRLAGWGLIALLIAVFPANIHMALNPQSYPEITPVLLWIRLPLQFVMIAWAYWFTGSAKE